MNLRDKLKFWIALNNYVEMIVGPAVAPLSLDKAVADSLSYVKAYGGTKQANIPDIYTQVNYVTNTAQTEVNTGLVIDRSKSYVFEYRGRAVTGSWYILQARESASAVVMGLSGSNSNGNFILSWAGGTTNTTSILRSSLTIDHIYYVRGEVDVVNGTLTLYVKDETSNTEETVTGTCSSGQGVYPINIGLLGNLLGNQMVQINNDVYMARITENGVTIMDYVPARLGATAGFYDKVSGTFKTAVTPANLVADGDTVPTPETPMDIVCNNGVLKLNTSATGYSTQTGTPTPTDPIDIVNYKQGDLILRGIGDYKDTYDATTGTITRNIGVKVLNGTEPWQSRSIDTCYVYTQPDMLQDGSAQVLSTHFEGNLQTLPVPSSLRLGKIMRYEDLIGVGYDNRVGGVENFKAWLAAQYAAGTPVIVYYPLATPTTEHYVGAYADGTVETINAHGKNLFDVVNAPEEFAFNLTYTRSVGELHIDVTGTFARVKLELPELVAGETYTMSFSSDMSGATVRTAYITPNTGSDYTDRTAVIRFTNGNFNATFVAPQSKLYILFYMSAGSVEPYSCNITNIQLEKASAVTSYAPYFDGGTATAEMLLKVGDYTDVQEVITGDVTRNVGIKVLDGTETTSWTVQAARAYTNKGNIGISDAKNDTNCISTHFGSVRNANIVSINTYGNTLFYYDLENLGITSVAQWNQFLADQYAAGTPVIVVYQLATETTESVAGQTLQVQAGDNTVEITQASLEGLELEAKYKKVP